MDEAVVEQHHEQEVGDAESEALTSSFDSGEEPNDESDQDYDPSRDRQVVLGVGVSSFLFEPCLFVACSVWMDIFCVGYDIVYSQLDPLRP